MWLKEVNAKLEPLPGDESAFRLPPSDGMAWTAFASTRTGWRLYCDA
jgi:hypothetical protein